MWSQLLPKSAVVVEATPAMWSSPPTLAEAACVAQATAQRRREFQAGRAAARAALRWLGIDQFDLLPGVYREPLWPAGIVGSITHTRDHCAVTVARQSEITSLGIDLEPADGLAAHMVRTVCSEDERRALRGMPGRAPDVWPKVIFSAKEAFFKAYFPQSRTFLDFHDVKIALHPRRAEYAAELVNRDVPSLFGRRYVVGRYAIRNGLIYTAVSTAT